MSKSRSYRKSLMIASAAAATMFVAAGACAAEKITLQLKWLPQAQFCRLLRCPVQGHYKTPAWMSRSNPAVRIFLPCKSSLANPPMS